MIVLLPELRAFARFLARERSAADDLVQDALVRALAALHQFQDETNLKAWLFTILRNRFYEGQRRRRREAAVIAEQRPATEAIGPAQEGQADLGDLARMLWRLPPSQREALILIGAQGLSQEDAARVCGVPVGTMKARLSRARSALATAMQEPKPNG